MLEKNKDVEVMLADANHYMVLANGCRNLASDLIRKLPVVYGTCKKQLVCQHYSYEFSVDEDEFTVIEVGDVVEFGRYPQMYGKTSRSPSCQVCFDIPLDEEYFDFFTSYEPVTCRDLTPDA